MSGSFFCRHWHQPWRALGLPATALFLALGGISGCLPPDTNVLEGKQGAIRLDAINRIVDDPELTEAEQRQALRDLGIADEELIDVLIRGL